MKTIHTFQEMHALVAQREKPLRIAAVCPDDEATSEALRYVEEHRLAQVVRVSDTDAPQAAAQAVGLVRRGEADVLMKGLVGTDVLLRAVLNKEHGLLTPGAVLTHLSVAEIPGHPKLLFFTDAAVIPYPTQEQRIQQIVYATRTARRLGISQPRVALLHCAEHGGRQFPFVDGYANICQMAARGEFGPCIVDGPLDVKTACSASALAAKHLTSPLEGQSDVLIMPDIEAGNIFYKTLTLFTRTQTAGMLCGAQCPIVVPSRGDSTATKVNSILFALASL